MTLNRQWLLKARPHGMIGPDNFEFTETPIPQIGDSEILVQNQYFVTVAKAESASDAFLERREREMAVAGRNQATVQQSRAAWREES